MKRSTFAFALLAALAALVITGCGGGSSSSSSQSSRSEGSSETADASTGGDTISGGEVSGLGTVLVDSEGMTVYEFTEDSGTKSNCYGECEAAWPPVTATGKPAAGEGATSADLGTAKRKDGTLQVTYKGHPLYTFTGDSSPGEATGNEDDGTWFVLDESGSPVEGTASAAAAEPESESTSAESSGGGY